MARIVLGIGTSHTPMLNATAEDWYANFAAIDRQRPHRDKEGRPIEYEKLFRQADPRACSVLERPVVIERHGLAQCRARRSLTNV